MMQVRLLKGYLERNCVEASCDDGGEVLLDKVEEKNRILSRSMLERNQSVLTLL